ncbi:hypothetical protein [Lacunimicrobium album]
MSTAVVTTDNNEKTWQDSLALLPSNTIHRVTQIGILCAAANVLLLKVMVIANPLIAEWIDQAANSLGFTRSGIFVVLLTMLCIIGIPVWSTMAAIVTWMMGSDWKNVVYNAYYGLLGSFAIFGAWFYPDLFVGFQEMIDAIWPMSSSRYWYYSRVFRNLASGAQSSDVSVLLIGSIVCAFVVFLLTMTAASVGPRQYQLITFRYLPKSPSLVFLLFSYLPGAVLALTMFFVEDLHLPASEFVALNLLGIVLVPAIAWIYSRRYEMAVMCCLNYLGLGGMAMWLMAIYRA